MENMSEFELQLAALPEDFIIWHYKIDPCPDPDKHPAESCVWAHPNDHHRRRAPSTHAPVYCKSMRSKHVCFMGDACPKAHTLQEYRLHPARFRTERCRYGSRAECPNPLCFFAHTDAELRTPQPAATTAPATPQLQQASAAPLAGLLSPAAGSPQLQAAAAALAAGAGLASVNDAALLLYVQQQAAQQQQVSSGLSSLGLQLGLQPPGLAASALDSSSFTSSHGASFTSHGSADSVTSHAVLAGLGLGGGANVTTGDSGPMLVLLDGKGGQTTVSAAYALQSSPLLQAPGQAMPPGYLAPATPLSAAGSSPGLGPALNMSAPGSRPLQAQDLLQLTSAPQGLLQQQYPAGGHLAGSSNGGAASLGSSGGAVSLGGTWGSGGGALPLQGQVLSVTPTGSVALPGLATTPGLTQQAAGAVTGPAAVPSASFPVVGGGPLYLNGLSQGLAAGGNSLSQQLGAAAGLVAGGGAHAKALSVAGGEGGADGGPGGQLDQLVALMLRTLKPSELRSVHMSIGQSLQGAPR